jgi:hypothetical protein
VLSGYSVILSCGFSYRSGFLQFPRENKTSIQFKEADFSVEKKTNKRRQKNFQVFLQDEEWERFLEIYQLAQSRFKHPGIPLKKSFVIRRLVGLEPPDELVTESDIDYFLRRKSGARRIIVDWLPPTEARLTEKDTKPDEKFESKKAEDTFRNR